MSKNNLMATVLVVSLSAWPTMATGGQDKTKPPISVEGKGPVKSATLIKKADHGEEAKNPSDPLKGSDWVEMEMSGPTAVPGTSDEMILKSPDKKFSLRFKESPENEADTAAYQVTLIWTGREKSPIPLGISGGAFISPDSKYIVLNPLVLIDVDAWKIYDLGKTLKLEGYFNVERWANNGKQFVVSIVQYPYDPPPGDSIEYWLIELE